MNVINVKNLAFSYNGKKVFEDVNFEINKGEFVKLSGPNGSGKSTLIKLLTGELSLMAGEIYLMGKSINRFSDWQKIGYLPQNKGVGVEFPATVYEIVLTGLYNKKKLFKFYTKTDREKVKNALAYTGMQGFENSMLRDLSGGQLGRVMLSRLLVADPEILILDEPMTGLDVKAISEVYGILQRLIRERNVTVLMISHDVTKQDNIFDRTLCLAYGNLMEIDKEQVEKELRSLHTHPQEQNGNI